LYRVEAENNRNKTKFQKYLMIKRKYIPAEDNGDCPCSGGETSGWMGTGESSVVMGKI